MEMKIGSLGAWIRASERMPDAGETVLFYDVRYQWLAIGWLRGEHFWMSRSETSRVPAKYVSHWQPLAYPELSDADEQLRLEFRKRSESARRAAWRRSA